MIVALLVLANLLTVGQVLRLEERVRRLEHRRLGPSWDRRR